MVTEIVIKASCFISFHTQIIINFIIQIVNKAIVIRTFIIIIMDYINYIGFIVSCNLNFS